MPATESLTIEILGDSSGLSQALDDALARVESLQSASESASSSAGGIGGRLASVSTALQPLQQVSQQLSRISQQASALAQQPISLNVQPALSALQSLMAAIQAVAAQLSALSQPGPRMGPIGPGGPSPGTPPRTSPSPGASAASTLATAPSLGTTAMTAMAAPSGVANAAMASGTEGPGGQSSALMASLWASATRATTPESPSVAHSGTVIEQGGHPEATRRTLTLTDPAQLPIREWGSASPNGSPRESALDSRGAARTPASFSSSATSIEQSTPLDNSSSTVNHFGGITIEVRETADVNALMRDLRLQGLATRHRQG